MSHLLGAPHCNVEGSRQTLPENHGGVADKAYDVAGLVSVFLELNVHPHVIQGNKKNRRRVIDERTTRQVGYGITLGKCCLVENAFGWLKQTGLMRKIREPSGWELARGGGTSCFVIR